MWNSVENGFPVTDKQVLIRTENGVYWAGRLERGLEWWATSRRRLRMYIEGPEE